MGDTGPEGSTLSLVHLVLEDPHLGQFLGQIS